MRFRLRPSIGNTIFALAVLLIALMAVVAAINSGLSVRVGGMIGTISRTYIPIYGMLARAHVRSLEQSLALRQAAIAALSGDGDIAAFVDEQKERGALVVQELTQARQTIAAQAAESSGVEDRVLLGRLDAQIEAAIKARAG
ncbi:hypothetical protein NK718_00040 [Alsobacter sp. SYSU M60028]|uniref:Methyl-accepting chemotaxis protein n=1 Tax=Alsobacter ponti TaxID=2962936 RepID=A0ABT1L6C4_9HYPH|nr:hypothetical protein [Alsobacter ponti]MCP8936892.1 hypothetical protein [Alsobacter ponti]